MVRDDGQSKVKQLTTLREREGGTEGMRDGGRERERVKQGVLDP